MGKLKDDMAEFEPFLRELRLSGYLVQNKGYYWDIMIPDPNRSRGIKDGCSVTRNRVGKWVITAVGEGDLPPVEGNRSFAIATSVEAAQKLILACLRGFEE